MSNAPHTFPLCVCVLVLRAAGTLCTATASVTTCAGCGLGLALSGTTCAGCYSGWVRATTTSACLQCGAGKYSTGSTCVRCTDHTTSLAGSTFCLCDNGYGLTATSAGICVLCPAGTYHKASDNPTAITVPIAVGATCQACPVGYTSLAGQSACNYCADGYGFNDAGVCVQCPADTFHSVTTNPTTVPTDTLAPGARCHCLPELPRGLHQPCGVRLLHVDVVSRRRVL